LGPVWTFESPGSSCDRSADDDAVVARQLRDGLGGASGLEVARGRHAFHASWDEFVGDEARVGERAGADGEVEALGDQIDATMGLIELESDVRIFLEEIEEGLFQERFAEGADADAPPRHPLYVAEQDLGGLDLAQGVADALKIDAPCFGEVDLAGRPLQEPHSERFLEACEPATDR